MDILADFGENDAESGVLTHWDPLGFRDGGVFEEGGVDRATGGRFFFLKPFFESGDDVTAQIKVCVHTHLADRRSDG
jgi:hypothetical protein